MCNSFPSFYRLFTLLVICILSTTIFSQTDSLLRVAIDMPDGEKKAELYKNLAFSLFLSSPDSTLMVCELLEEMGERLNDIDILSKASYLKGIAKHQLGSSLEAIEDMDLAIKYCTQLNKLDNLGLCYSFKGTIYTRLGLYDLANEHLLKSAEISELAGDTLGIGIAYHNIGNNKFYHQAFEQAAKYYHIALNNFYAAEDYGHAGQTHIALANAFPHQLDSLQFHLKKGEPLLNAYGSEYQFLTLYHTYAYYHDKNAEYQKAIDYEWKTLALASEFDDFQFQAAAHIGMGETFFKLNQQDSAIYHLQAGIRIAESFDLKSEIQDGYIDLADMHYKAGHSSLAIKYYEKALALKDSLHAEEITQQIQTNTARFDLERKERQIAEQELQIANAQNARNQLIIIGISLLALIAGIYQWYLNRQQKRKQIAEFALVKQKAEADRLRDLDALKTNFFTNISHELRTPLTLILSPLADVLGNVKSIPIREKLGIAKRNAQRLLDMVNEIMDLSKVEAGKLELQESNVELLHLVKRIFYSFESLAALRRIKFNLNTEIEDIYVSLDRDKLEKVLHNLLANAIKYTGANGEVSLNLQQHNQELTFMIKDTGHGIHPEDLPHVFDRFYQAKKGNVSLQGGSGIGLALSKELSQLMGGSLEVESQLNQGTIFCLTLPLQKAERLQKHLQDIPEAPLPSSPGVFAPIAIQGEKPRLLIVEDNPEMGRYLVQILAENYQCVLATDGQEGLKQLQLNHFDCITSDVMMPNMDGFELREKINKNEQWRYIPFLLLTARHLEDDKVRGFHLGIDDYITKPFSTRELQARIHNLITNKIERETFIKAEQNETVDEQLSVDQKLLKTLENEVLTRLDDPNFGVDELARSINYSAKQTGRIIKKLTGMTSVGFILEVRLQKARELLEKKRCASVTQAHLEVGINSISYFTKKFTERFGKNPKELL